MPDLTHALVWLIAYLVGAIPFGYLVARARGVNIFAVGSGNIGATNVGRVLGRPFGIAVFLLDFAKGALPVVVAGRFGEGAIEVGAGLAAFLGHLYPIYLGFRGGKGVATGAGVVAVLFPLPAAIAILVWIATVLATRYVSLASVLAAVALAVCHVGPHGAFDDPRTAFALFAGGLIVVKHRANLARLGAATENRITENDYMQPIARSLHVLSLGLWSGMAVFFTFVVALSLFRSFDAVAQAPERPAWFPLPAEFARVDDAMNGPKEQGSRAAGVAVAPLFAWYFLLQGACGFIALGTAMGWMNAGKLHSRRVGVVGLALVLVLIGWPIERKVAELRVQRNEATDAYLRADPTNVDQLRPGMMEARQRFFAWHQVSLYLNLATVVLVLVATCLAGQLPHVQMEREKELPRAVREH